MENHTASIVLIRAMVACVRPQPGKTIGDPACGTGGFFLAAVLFFDNRVASAEPWTREVWYYDYRTNVHHTLKKKPLRFEDLADFIDCYRPASRHTRRETWDEAQNPEGRWRRYSYAEIMARDKTSLDIFWLKESSQADLDNLPAPDELAEEIVENLEAGLNSFREILAAL